MSIVRRVRAVSVVNLKGCPSGGGGLGEARSARGRAGSGRGRSAAREARWPNLFIVHFGTRKGECEEWRGFAGH